MLAIMHDRARTRGCTVSAGLLIASVITAQAADPPAGRAAGDGFVQEAPFVPGWPAPQAPDVIDEAELPVFRAVEHPDFMVLLRYINQNGIPMTAPVTYPLTAARPDDAGAQRGRRFLLPAADSDPGKVPAGARLVDVPAQRVLRISLRGEFDRQRIAKALDALVAAARERGLAAAVAPILAGYNSPMRPPEQQTYEILLPVRPASAGAATAQAAL